MDRIEVESSSIRSIGYDKANLTLEVEFRNENLYRYTLVPEAVYLELMAAESQGKYFNKNIRNVFDCEKV